MSRSARHLGAFECRRCPQNNDPEAGRSCPAWWETMHTNVTTGESRMWKSCAWEQLPYYLVEVIKASNRPAAAIESTRNEIALGLTRIANGVNRETPTQVSYDDRDGQRSASTTTDIQRSGE